MSDEQPKRRASGPSGKNLIPQRAVRIPVALWERLGITASANGTTRNAVLNALVEEYCDRNDARE